MAKSIEKLNQLSFPQIFDVSSAPSFPHELFSLGNSSTVQEGTVLVHYGEIPDRIYYLHTGTIIGYRLRCDVDLSMAYIIKEGFFAEGWYFSHRHSMDEIIAEENCTITTFNRKAITLLIQHPEVINNFLFTLAIKSTSITTRLESFKKKSIKEQLKEFILNQFSQMNEEKSIELHLSQKDLARIINVHPVSISRAFAELKKEMDIQTFKNRIVIFK